MKKSIVVLSAIGLFLGGCGGVTRWNWVPLRGQSQQQYYADQVYCKKIASSYSYQRYGNYASSGQRTDVGMMLNCLRGRGYRINVIR